MKRKKMAHKVDSTTATIKFQRRNDTMDISGGEKTTSWVDIPIEIWTLIFTIAGYEWKRAFKMTCKVFAKACESLKVSKKLSYIRPGNEAFFSMTYLEWASKEDCDVSENIAFNAGLTGNIAALKWIKENVGVPNPFDRSVYIDGIRGGEACNGAAVGGHLEALEWARENGATWDTHTCVIAASGGHFDMLKWLIENGCPCAGDVCFFASKNSNLEIIKWIHERKTGWCEYSCAYGAMGDYYQLLRNSVDGSPNFSDDVESSSFNHGNIEIMKYVISNGCDPIRSVSIFAVIRGDFEFLEWIKERGFKFDVQSCRTAAKMGNLAVLKWLRENGCPWDERVIEDALEYNRLDVAKWALENGCPYSGKFRV